MNQPIPVSGVLGLDLSYSSLLPTVSLVVDGLCVVLLVGVVAALLASLRASTYTWFPEAADKPVPRKFISLARSRTP